MSNYIPAKTAPDFEERYPDASAKATQCAMNLVATGDLLEKCIASLIAPFDLSPASGLALSILADAGTPLSPNEIAERLIISRASVTSLLDSLEKRGYVNRRPHPTDRRMIWVEPTELGRQIAGEFRPIVHRQQKAWLSVLSEEEQAQLVEMLQRIQPVLLEANQ
jgi:MarR family transcriptional regulator, 2-MHQ and catechol-resistance regulon repressor